VFPANGADGWPGSHGKGDGTLAPGSSPSSWREGVITVQSFGAELLLFDLVVLGELTQVVFDMGGGCSLVRSKFLHGRNIEVKDSSLRVRWVGVTDIG